MDEQTFKARTKNFGLAVIQLVETLPRTRSADIICRQLLRSATSLGANYRSACRGRSGSDVIAKLGIVEEEADESIYWLEILEGAKLATGDKLSALSKEANEIVAMTVASIKTLRKRERGDQPSIQNLKSKIGNSCPFIKPSY